MVKKEKPGIFWLAVILSIIGVLAIIVMVLRVLGVI